MFRALEPTPEFALHDRRAFGFRHRLGGHPALELDHLSDILPGYGPNQAYFSMRRLQREEDFFGAISQERGTAGAREAIARVRDGEGYIMIREPETHPSLREVHDILLGDVEMQLRRTGLGKAAIDARSYLFISSPGSVTPFHFDRASNFLLQFRGNKQVTVFKPWDSRVIRQQELEMHTSGAPQAVAYKPESEAFGQRFECGPGDALHIPFVAGHHVLNGSDDVSVTLSVFFNHHRSLRQLHALKYNHRARKLWSRAGLAPLPVGRFAPLDAGKAWLSRSYDRLSGQA